MAMEQFLHELDKMEKKEKKFRQMKAEDTNLADYEDLTVTDEDYDEETRQKYSQFLEKRRQRKEQGLMDPEKFFRDDQPYQVAEEERENDEIQWQEIKEKLYNL